MDAKTAIEIIRDCGIGKQTAADDCYDFTEEIADLIQQQEKDAEIGRAAVTIHGNVCGPLAFKTCTITSCRKYEFCRLRAGRGGEDGTR